MKLFGVLLIVLCTFSTQSYAKVNILELRNNMLDEVKNILEDTVQVHKGVDNLLADVQQAQAVHSALKLLAKNNLTICLNHCKNSVDADEGVNIGKAIEQLYSDMGKFGRIVHERVAAIFDCATKKHVSDVTPRTFHETIVCINMGMQPLEKKLFALADATKVLENFLNNITHRIQFDCTVNLTGEQTLGEKKKSEQMAVDCLNEIGRTLCPTCKPMIDKIYEIAEDIRDYTATMNGNIEVCVHAKMEDIRQRLIKEKNFDFNTC